MTGTLDFGVVHTHTLEYDLFCGKLFSSFYSECGAVSVLAKELRGLGIFLYTHTVFFKLYRLENKITLVTSGL